MQTDVAALAAMPAGVTTDKMQSLVESLATIAGDLATAMTQPPQRLVRDFAGGQLYEFRLEPTIDHGADPPVLELFDLTVTRATMPDDVPWPTVYLSDPAHPLRQVPQADGVMRYFYDDDKPPAFQSLTQHYVFPGETPGRDAVAFQTGQVAAAVQRNADLVTTAKTADAFLYQTPWVSFSAAAVPFLQTASPIAIGTGADLTAPLTNALTELLTIEGDDSPVPGPSTVRLLVTYERTLAGANGSGPIAMSQPVVYVPPVEPCWRRDRHAGRRRRRAGDELVHRLGHPAAPGRHGRRRPSIFATADLAMTRPLVETSRLTVPLA